mmetsp:Transcript_11932/g.11486  ORF Transcript_11932/g.11486 Transcript_11932/m.11486 type:complete len:208 (-) Transcript_11932:220-843(-)|eukprot:CAMPEP_0197832186 /NCGR_PEP_ID=MMETSP1437-20131217/13606_1 /TAXON_ID=49252 ORGANISM="Eucampia antarctica, Strain CCMP1452" /NCGR_SAMPLE_ID=MMETSP1437 /ASSEMBLY_ACC=CAM_ASM_001096 /LENGTH=207 /DNA_ID=CAMNT_0043435409 /DNA_START=185 /DNA_END=808 /DNA_ORIENTATION=-
MSVNSQSRSGSGFFAKAKSTLSLFSSKGDKAADVVTLRGTGGSDFEGEAKISREGTSGLLCPCLGGGSKDKSKTGHVLIKGPSCFIFSDETSPSPKYAIKLDRKTANLHDNNKKENHVLVTLEDGLGDVEFQFIFSDIKSATKFTKTVTEQVAIAAEDTAKERLGHRNMKMKSSVHYAADIASGIEKNQPEKPLSPDDFLQVAPQVY